MLVTYFHRPPFVLFFFSLSSILSIPHTNKVKQLLLQKEIMVLDWPGNSPDLNPIENLWAIIKLEQRKKDCTSREKMTKAIIDIWFDDSKIKHHCATLVDTMPARIQEVIRKRGGHIHY